jgi:hypothetical protein
LLSQLRCLRPRTKIFPKIVKERQLGTLRIAKGNAELWDQFGLAGVPNTVIIDESGYVRIRHEGSIPDVPRYLEADLKAITASGTRDAQMHSPASGGSK